MPPLASILGGFLSFTAGGGAPPGDSMDVLSAYLNAATNTALGTTAQKVPLDTVSYDTQSMWNVANTRAIPSIAGYYLVSVHASMTLSGSQFFPLVYLNGALAGVAGTQALLGTNGSNGGGVFLVNCNGSTDYIEFYITKTASSAVAYDNLVTHTYMQIMGPFGV